MIVLSCLEENCDVIEEESGGGEKKEGGAY